MLEWHCWFLFKLPSAPSAPIAPSTKATNVCSLETEKTTTKKKNFIHDYLIHVLKKSENKLYAATKQLNQYIGFEIFWLEQVKKAEHQVNNNNKKDFTHTVHHDIWIIPSAKKTIVQDSKQHEDEKKFTKLNIPLNILN